MEEGHKYSFGGWPEMPWKEPMPYRLKGNTVLVKRGKKWMVLKKHKTRREAMAHIRALYANVKEA